MPTTRFHPSRRGATPSVAEQMRSRARKVEAKGEKVIYLQVGQPSTGAPAAPSMRFIGPVIRAYWDIRVLQVSPNSGSGFRKTIKINMGSRSIPNGL